MKKKFQAFLTLGHLLVGSKGCIQYLKEGEFQPFHDTAFEKSTVVSISFASNGTVTYYHSYVES